MCPVTIFLTLSICFRSSSLSVLFLLGVYLRAKSTLTTSHCPSCADPLLDRFGAFAVLSEAQLLAQPSSGCVALERWLSVSQPAAALLLFPSTAGKLGNVHLFLLNPRFRGPSGSSSSSKIPKKIPDTRKNVTGIGLQACPSVGM